MRLIVLTKMRPVAAFAATGRELGVIAYLEGVVFIAILVVALAYVWRKGDLAWVRPEDQA